MEGRVVPGRIAVTGGKVVRTYNFALYLMKATSKEGMWKSHSSWETINLVDGESKKLRKDVLI